MKAVVDKDLCTGCGLCINTCPEVFELEADVAIVKVDTIADELVDSAKEASQNCPVEAIKIEE